MFKLQPISTAKCAGQSCAGRRQRRQCYACRKCVCRVNQGKYCNTFTINAGFQIGCIFWPSDGNWVATFDVIQQSDFHDFCWVYVFQCSVSMYSQSSVNRAPPCRVFVTLLDTVQNFRIRLDMDHICGPTCDDRCAGALSTHKKCSTVSCFIIHIFTNCKIKRSRIHTSFSVAESIRGSYVKLDLHCPG
jgi:hypothetical protein